MEMIGQANIKNFLANLSLDSLPHTLMLKGSQGCGKHLLCNLIADKLNLNLINATNDISGDWVNKLYLSGPALYIIEGYNITEREYNIILKLLEEPPTQVYLILIVNNLNNIPETIVNRAIRLNFEEYSFEELDMFAKKHSLILDSKYINSLFKTPGSLLNIINYNIKIEDIENLVSDIIARFNSISLPTALTVLNRLNLKDNYDKIDLGTFINLLYIRSIDTYIDTKNKYYFNISKIVQLYSNKLGYQKANKQNLVTNLIIDMWKEGK